MDNHLIAFLDILGFTSLIRGEDAEAEKAIIKLLTSLAAERGNFKQERMPSTENTTSVSVRPAISTFSDHIVYSYPLSVVMEGIPFWTFQALANSAAAIAYDAMQLGCLIRGAITVGPLYHDEGVVFGRAMIDAYEMESRVALNPRIVLSEAAAGLMNANAASGGETFLLFRDDDGLCCLDFMSEAFDQLQRSSTSANRLGRSKNWIAMVRLHCDMQIERLTAANNMSGARHWRWVRNRFDKTIARRHPFVTGEPNLLN